MGVSVRGHSDPHLHSPCPQCGYATRYKQWPNRCACPDAEWRKVYVTSTSHVAGIQAEQEALDAAREWPTGPALRIAPHYAAGRPQYVNRRHTHGR